MINGSASVLGHHGNTKHDSPQEFASLPSKLDSCVCACVARLWLRGFEAKYDSEKMDLVVVKLGGD